jgi:hypothetical protein
MVQTVANSQGNNFCARSGPMASALIEPGSREVVYPNCKTR